MSICLVIWTLQGAIDGSACHGNEKSTSVVTLVESMRGRMSGAAVTDVNGDGCLDIVQNGYWLQCPANPADGRR